MSRDIAAVLRIMRLAIGRRNENDPDSKDGVLLQYVNDFMALTMSNEFKIFEQFRSFNFTIDETTTDGIFKFPDANETSEDFINVNSQVLISLTDPVGSSISWQNMTFYQDPLEFYGYWGFNNEDILITGTPTDVLYYGNEFVFRTIPDDSYTVKVFGYMRVSELSNNDQLPFDYWMRFLAYGAAREYAADYRLDKEAQANIERNYKRERILLMSRTHNQLKTQRPIPNF